MYIDFKFKYFHLSPKNYLAFEKCQFLKSDTSLFYVQLDLSNLWKFNNLLNILKVIKQNKYIYSTLIHVQRCSGSQLCLYLKRRTGQSEYIIKIDYLNITHNMLNKCLIYSMNKQMKLNKELWGYNKLYLFIFNAKHWNLKLLIKNISECQYSTILMIPG